MSQIPNFDFYGGSTVMRLSDANGVPYMSCCATKKASGVFGFYIFRGPNLEEVPITPFCTGRGSMNYGGWWVAAQGKEWFNGPIPGFAPWPVGGHDARVDSLISQIAAMGQQLTAIETAIGNAGAIDPTDREALNRLRGFLGLSNAQAPA